MDPQPPEEMLQESMAPVRQAAIGPMLAGPGTGGTLLGTSYDR